MYIFSIPSRSLRSLGSRERNDKENCGPPPAAIASTIPSNISYLTTTFEVIADASPEVYGDHEIEDEGTMIAYLLITITILY